MISATKRAYQTAILKPSLNIYVSSLDVIHFRISDRSHRTNILSKNSNVFLLAPVCSVKQLPQCRNIAQTLFCILLNFIRS